MLKSKNSRILNYYPKTKEEKINLFHFKNIHLKEASEIYQNQDYQEINLEEYYKIVYCRNNNNPLGKNNYLNQDFLNNLNNLELPFEKEIGESQLLEKYIYNSIIIELTGEGQSNKNWVVTKDLHILEEVKGKDFVISAPVTYVGRNRNANNARNLYALAIDLDYVGENQIKNTLYQISNNKLPIPNIITNSGTGLHLYYLLEQPIPLYRNTQELLNRIKYGITNNIWNQFTSGAERQYQNVIQGYRLPETKTKLGTITTSWVNKKSYYYSIKELNNWVTEANINQNDLKLSQDELNLLENSVSSSHKPSRKLEEAKEKWPEWYQERIIEGKPRKYIVYKKDLYNWWLKILYNRNNVTLGHRYYCALALVSFATKCNVPYEEVKQDLYSLIDEFDLLSIEEENHFTKGDVEDALKIYGSDKAHKFKREFVSQQCAIDIKPNKRNGRKREEHLKFARASKTLKRQFTENYKYKEKDNQRIISEIVQILYDNKDKNLSSRKISELSKYSESSIIRWKEKAIKQYEKEYPNERIPLKRKNYLKRLNDLLDEKGMSILNNKSNLAKELNISRMTLYKLIKSEEFNNILEKVKEKENTNKIIDSLF